MKSRMDRVEEMLRETGLRMVEMREDSARERRDAWRQWGKLANKMGTIVEDIVAPNLPRIVREHFGVTEILESAQHVRKRHPTEKGREREFDVIIATADTLFVNETKSTIRTGDVESFAAALSQVPEYFPHYAHLNVVGIMSALAIPPSIIDELTARGIFAMVAGDDTMELANAEALGRPPDDR